MRMKTRSIIHVVWAFKNGGIETMLVNIANNQSKSGEKIYIIVINNLFDKSLAIGLNKEIKIIKLGRKLGSKNIIPILKVNLLILLIYPKIIHFHSLNIAKLIIKFPFIKFIATIHDTRFSERYFKKFDVYIAISKSVFKSIQEVNKNIKPILCYNAVDFNLIRKKSNYKEIREIVCVGRLSICHKGQDKIIKAIDILNRNNSYKYYLTIIGDGPSEKELQELTKKFDLNDYVTFLGNQSNSWVNNNLSSFDLFIQASNYEGFGLTVLEAMGAKVPTLLSNVEGHLEISDYGRYSVLFNSNDPEELAAKVKNLSKNWMNLELFSEKAYEFVSQKFAIEQQVNTLKNIYLSSLQKPQEP